jgi:hypothetical protein
MGRSTVTSDLSLGLSSFYSHPLRQLPDGVLRNTALHFRCEQPQPCFVPLLVLKQWSVGLRYTLLEYMQWHKTRRDASIHLSKVAL